jgi:serine/threonine protein kinase
LDGPDVLRQELAMPAPATSIDFLALVRKSGVVPRPTLDAFEQALPAGQMQDAKQLATMMVREGLLTVLQAKQLLRGRWRNFILAGKYKLLEYIGSGGMGQVYLCEHMRMERRVAVKILPPEKSSEPVCLERFFREARAAAALNHPNIVRAHDIDHDDSGASTGSTGTPLYFLVMEYVDGSSLQEIVTKFGRLSVERACHYVAQTAIALQHAHDAGLIHRDVKPANLLLDRSGLIKVLDLGLARFFNDAGDDLTRQLGAHNLIGTADYLAPEQAVNSHAADIRADIYSLGVTFFFLLTGRSPFKEGTLAQKLMYHRLQQPESVTRIRSDVPAGVAAVIERMLAKDPTRRFQQPVDVRDALAMWTDAPLPPPPQAEMPRLSRAARRQPAGGPDSRPTLQSGARSTLHNRPFPTTQSVGPTEVPVPTGTPPAKSSRFRLLARRIFGWIYRSNRRH